MFAKYRALQFTEGKFGELFLCRRGGHLYTGFGGHLYTGFGGHLYTGFGGHLYTGFGGHVTISLQPWRWVGAREEEKGRIY